MLISTERPSIRWLALYSAWVVVVAFALTHTLAFRDYINLLSRAGQRLPAINTPLQRIVPTNYADAQTWVRYALDFDQGAPWRVRHTTKDNAPSGREVHWNSAFAHYVAAAGRIQAGVTGQTLPLATEEAVAWLNLPLLLGTIFFFSTWITRRAGAGAGALTALGLLGTEAFYAGFSPNYADHHGVLSAAGFGVVLGVIGMGAGWWQTGAATAGTLIPSSRNEARSAAILSALCGAIGMWFSAASTIPAIGLVGAAGIISVWCFGRSLSASGAQFDGSLWRLWGRLGAAASVCFYLLEYAPNHLGLRLEVNHPIYALAWWSGAEIVALLADHHLAGTGGLPKPLGRLALCLAALAVAPLTIALGGIHVFVVSDPFVAKVPMTVAEGLSLFAAKDVFGWQAFFGYAGWNLLPVPVALWLIFRRTTRSRFLLVFSTLVALGFVVLLFSQVRWSLGASGPVLCLLLVATAAALDGRSPRTRWLVVGAISGLLFIPTAIRRITVVEETVSARRADRMDLQQILYRDAAAAIRASQPEGDIVLLASPNGSCGMGYYGQFKTIGTLYWENYRGMRAAAEIFCASDEESALKLVRSHGITHIAMISEESFLSQFFSILHPELPPDDLRKTFGYSLLVKQTLPRWLRPIPYKAPTDVAIPDLRVLLLQVVPEQKDFEAVWHIGRAQLALGEFENATQSFARSGEMVPPPNRAELLQASANACYQFDAHDAALRLYRLSLTAGDNAVTRVNLAWLLATSRFDQVRNGEEALKLAEPLARSYPGDINVLAAHAAALAETSRWEEANAILERARDLAIRGGDKTSADDFGVRLEAYRAHKPWRR